MIGGAGRKRHGAAGARVVSRGLAARVAQQCAVGNGADGMARRGRWATARMAWRGGGVTARRDGKVMVAGGTVHHGCGESSTAAKPDFCPLKLVSMRRRRDAHLAIDVKAHKFSDVPGRKSCLGGNRAWAEIVPAHDENFSGRLEKFS